jgi:hypothetical protein
VLEQKVAANCQVIPVMRQRLTAGQQVARVYQEPELACLKRQAEVVEDLVAERQLTSRRHRLIPRHPTDTGTMRWLASRQKPLTSPNWSHGAEVRIPE